MSNFGSGLCQRQASQNRQWACSRRGPIERGRGGNLGQDGGVNLEVGGGILDPNANIVVEINNRDIQDNYNFGEVNANMKEGVDGAVTFPTRKLLFPLNTQEFFGIK